MPEKESDKERQRQGGSPCVDVHIDFEYLLFPPTVLSKTGSFFVPGTYLLVLAGL